MFAAIYYFVHELENSRIIRLLLLVIVGLYSGSGDYHGFYWVVESFYQLAVFFIIFGILIRDQKIKVRWLLPICFLFIFIHPTSAFLSAIFILYPIFLFLLAKTDSTRAFKNSFLLIISLGIPFLVYLILSKAYPSANSPQSIDIQTRLIREFFLGRLSPISFSVIWQNYFAIFFINIGTIVIYFAMFALAYYQRKFKLLAIFFSISVVVLLSSFIPYGSRTLNFLWPTTFFLIAYFLVGIWRVLEKTNSRLKLRYLTMLPVAALFFIVTIFNIISVSAENGAKNYNWYRPCISQAQNFNLYFTSHESMNAFSLYQDSEKNLHFLSIEALNSLSNSENLLIETKNENLKPQPLNGIEEYLTSRITRRSALGNVQYPQNAWTTPAADLESIKEFLDKKNLELESYLDCGHFKTSIIKTL